MKRRFSFSNIFGRGKKSRANAKNELDTEPMSTAAALDSSVFEKLNPSRAIPKDWKARGRKAWSYYIEEPLVKNCINSWRTFAVGDEIKVSCGDEGMKKEAVAFANRLNITEFVKDMILQLLVKGDAIGYKKRKEGADNRREIEEVICVNPLSLELKYSGSELIEAKQFNEARPGSEPLDLPVENIIHIKWDAPAFSIRGNSLVLPAFSSIELLRDYRRAEQAIAKRWATPFRLIKVGGSYGQKLVMPDQAMLESVRNIINKMDMKSGLVVPFYVSVETHGTEGAVLNVEEKVREVKEDIIVALGLSRSLVSGDGPNFATANVSMQKMIVMIREVKQAARRILAWLYEDMVADKGKAHEIQFLFNDLDPTDAVDFKKLLIELYDRKLISRSSLQLKMDLNPEIEQANRKDENTRLDIYDEKAVKPIIDMVLAGLMSVEDAQERLGLTRGQRINTEVNATTLKCEICDNCSYFNAEDNFCSVLQVERTFDSPACRFFTA